MQRDSRRGVPTFPRSTSRRGQFLRTLMAINVLLAIVVPAAVGLGRVQSTSRRDLEARFRSRGALAAGFASSYIADLVARERTQAAEHLGGKVTENAYQALVGAFGFQAALLLDSKGRVLHVTPSKPSLIGTPIGTQYVHLTAALQGQVGVSKVVPSAAKAVPVLAFAVPYRSVAGRRVFSGAFQVNKTPLARYLDNAVSINPHAVYLVDDTGAIAASSPSSKVGDRHLQAENPTLFAAMKNGTSGHYTTGTGPAYFTSRNLPGTHLQIVASVQTAQLYTPIGGAARALPWVILGVLAMIAAFALWILFRSISGRRELAQLYGELELIARLDPLTGIFNRRHLQERTELDLRLAGRRNQPIAILMVDVDHFKRVNDTYGHETGDYVLRTVAQRIRTSMRIEDTVGRWGGEEFLAVLPFTSLDAAAIAAERLRECIASPALVTPSGVELEMTVSVGYTSGLKTDPEQLIAEADAALYAAKQAGRNRTMPAAVERQPATVSG